MSRKKPSPGDLVLLVADYSNAVGRHGPDSEQTRQIRAANPDNREFLDYADALDRVKWHLGGSGTEKPKGVDHPVMPECRGEKCQMCGEQAHHKVGEEMFGSDPQSIRHNLTAYLCCTHFRRVMGGTGTPWCEPNVNG